MIFHHFLGNKILICSLDRIPKEMSKALQVFSFYLGKEWRIAPFFSYQKFIYLYYSTFAYNTATVSSLLYPSSFQS